MNDTLPGLENNRFEALYQRWRNRPRRRGRWWRRIAVVLASAAALEFVSLAATFGWYWINNIYSYRLLDQFLLTRHLVSPFVFENPVNKYTKARYLGPLVNACIGAKLRQADTLLGWAMAPSVGILKQPYRVDHITGWRFTNAQGFSSSGDYDFFYARPKPRRTFRVIVTGASSVEGDGAEEPKLNLVSQFRERLDRELAGKLSPGYDRIEVINAGVGGYQSSQEYLYLISDLVTYEPDLVISYGGAVDVVRAWNAHIREGRVMEAIRTFRHEIDSRYLQQSFTIVSPLAMFATNVSRAVGCFIDELATSYFIGKLYEKTETIIRRLLGTPRKALEVETTTPDFSTPIKTAIATYDNSITLMMKAAEIYGFRMAFVLQSTMSTDNKPLTAIEKETFESLSATELRLRAQHWAEARRLFADHGAVAEKDNRFCFADISRPFEGVRERVWDDSRHLLGAGNRIVARAMVDALKACRQLPER
jgi:hypothetical protein